MFEMMQQSIPRDLDGLREFLIGYLGANGEETRKLVKKVEDLQKRVEALETRLALGPTPMEAAYQRRRKPE